MGGFILGIDIATEEAEGKQSKDTVSSLKTGLMGSFAGVGDTILEYCSQLFLVQWLPI